MQESADSPNPWRTPVLAVGTDPKMLINSHRTSEPGLLTGALMPPPAVGARIGNPAQTGDILANAVVASLLRRSFNSADTARRGSWRRVAYFERSVRTSRIISGETS